MYDTVNFWIGRGSMLGGSPFDVLPHLSEITQRKNEKSGYSCTGKVFDYTVNAYEHGISLKGSLAKFHLGDNIQTLTRKATQQAIERLSDTLHVDVSGAKVTRVDVSTVIATKCPPADYYPLLGDKPYFTRLLSTLNTLYYNNHQRQIIIYDKTKEAKAKDVQIPEILQNSNLLRYELRYTKRIGKQLKADVTAATLYNEGFYQSVVQNWYKEFKSITKLKQEGFMIDNVATPKDAEKALFAHLLQQAGQSTVEEFLATLKAQKRFKSRSEYSKLRADLNKMVAAPRGEQGDLMRELETAIYNVAKYAR